MIKIKRQEKEAELEQKSEASKLLCPAKKAFKFNKLILGFFIYFFAFYLK